MKSPKKATYGVYAIKSPSSGRIYIGKRKSVEKRLALHNAGRVKASKVDRPWQFIAIQTMESRGKAMWTEGSFKRSQGARSVWLEENKLNQ